MRLTALLCLLPLPALAEVPVVITDIPPVHALVAQVMGDLGAPVLLLARGADEHDFQLRPSQMQSIEDAGLIVWIGPELTPWLDRASQSSGAVKLGLLGAAGTKTRGFTEIAEAGAPEEAGSTDPHAWLAPQNALIWLPKIADELSRADPDHAGTYAANAAAAAIRITVLDDEIKTILAPVLSRPFVTYHNAYGYFAGHYGLAYAGALANGEAAEPGAAHLSALRGLLADGNIACVFPEAQHDPALAAQLLEGTTAEMGGALDPVGSTLDPGPLAYDALLRSIATTLVDCLKG